MKQVAPNADELQGHTADQTRVFDVPYIGSDQMTELRQDFFGQVTSILGEDRSGLFTNAPVRFWEEKRQQKADLVQLSRNSKLVLDDKSGHHIQLDDPDTVVAAIRDVVEASQQHRKLRSDPSK
jgi:pimeloyl-ACP methyl ester carboxylesterase